MLAGAIKCMRKFTTFARNGILRNVNESAVAAERDYLAVPDGGVHGPYLLAWTVVERQVRRWAMFPVSKDLVRLQCPDTTVTPFEPKFPEVWRITGFESEGPFPSELASAFVDNLLKERASCPVVLPLIVDRLADSARTVVRADFAGEHVRRLSVTPP